MKVIFFYEGYDLSGVYLIKLAVGGGVEASCICWKMIAGSGGFACL
jgi:hypothetical protein